MATLNTRIILRNDSTANWQANETTVLLKGEIGIEFNPEAASLGGKVRMKVGDGTHTWAELPYFSGTRTFEATLQEGETQDAALERVVGETKLCEGDIAVVKSQINGDHYSYTAYVYNGTNGTAWQVMDGNCNAKNVIFDSNVVFTEKVGTVTIPSTGSYEYQAAGMNLQDFLAGIFAKEDASELKTADASISISTVEEKVELGTTVTPKFAVTLNSGSYKYGPDTGVTATNYRVTNDKDTSEIVNAASGSFNPYTFTTVTTYNVSAKCDSTQGAIPKSNVGKEYANQRIAAHTDLTAKPKTIYSSYMPNFVGTVDTVERKVKLDASALNSAFIRKLTNEGSELSPETSYNIDHKWAQFFYALPAGRKNNLIAKDGNNITCTVTKITSCKVNFEGGVGEKDYDVFAIDNAALYGATKLQLSWS